MAKKHDARSKKQTGVRRDIRAANDGGFPITVKLDPDMQAVPFIKALALVGLKLQEDSAGCWWLRKEPAGWANKLPEPERSQVISGFASILKETLSGGTDRPTIEERIDAEREKLFGAMAIVALARGNYTADAGRDDYNLRRALDDCYQQLDKIAGELNVIGGDAKGAQP